MFEKDEIEEITTASAKGDLSRSLPENLNTIERKLNKKLYEPYYLCESQSVHWFFSRPTKKLKNVYIENGIQWAESPRGTLASTEHTRLHRNVLRS